MDIQTAGAGRQISDPISTFSVLRDGFMLLCLLCYWIQRALLLMFVLYRLGALYFTLYLHRSSLGNIV